jgi:hypothetical protein
MINDAQENGSNQINGVFAFPAVSCQPTPSGPSAACPVATSPSGLVTVYSQGSGLRSAYTIESALTIEQQAGKYAKVSATYLNALGEHQLMTRDFPAPAAKQLDFQYQSGGIFRENQIITNFTVFTPKGLTLFGFYAASWANSNISDVTNPYNSRVDYGRAAFAVRNRLVIGGSIPLRYGITASPLIFANSGSPYNVTTGLDENQDSQYNDRPAFLTGTSSANCNVASSFSSPPVGASYTPIPVNYCTGPATATVNLRLAKTIGLGPKMDAARAAAARAQAGAGAPAALAALFGGAGAGSSRRYTLTLGAQVSNLFNEIPYGIPVSTLTSSSFGQVTSLQTGLFASPNAVRRIMLQATFNF